MPDKFLQLSNLGAGEFEHINGSLIDHLKGTRAWLDSWAASKAVQDAGLYHAAYSTAGFTESLVSTECRQEIARIIGAEAEAIVYMYCACDRDFVWPQIGTAKEIQFKDRFTGELRALSHHELCDFCELTVANELEIATDNPDFIAAHGEYLDKLFVNMKPFLSCEATSSIELVLQKNLTKN